MSKFALFVVVCLSLQITLSSCAKADLFDEEFYQQVFTDWMQDYHKGYSAFEFLTRFFIFKKNVDFIEQFNARGETFEVGLNDWADLDIDEFKGLLSLQPYIARARDESIPEFTGEGHVSRANDVDWRTSGVVTAVKNQGSCGSCWTFGTAGAIESLYAIQTGNLVELSEQNLLDCETRSSGCNGGVPIYAMDYVKTNGGIATMASYPYEGAKKTCRYSTATKGADITGYTRVTKNSESALQAAVDKQPVIVAIHAGLQSFQMYKSGIYNDASCSSTALDHAVIAVGYGSDASGEYWIVKNSWGTSWGQKGYVHIARNQNNKCGIAADASFPTRTGGSTVAPTQRPATQPPQTQAPTQRPQTQAPTQRPATQPPQTQAPQTQAPQTQAPQTQAPQTQAPQTQAPPASSAYIFENALGAGWALSYSGTVTAVKTCGTGFSGCGISASVAKNGKLIFTRSSGAFATTGFTKLNFTIKSSAATSVQITVNTGTSRVTLNAPTGWGSAAVPLANLGNPASITSVTFLNTGNPTVTLSLDNVFIN